MGVFPAAAKKAGGFGPLSRKNPADPDSVRRYLASKFGENLGEVEGALRELAVAFPPDRLNESAYGLYERFRPKVARGKEGWGAAGELDLDRVRGLVPKKK